MAVKKEDENDGSRYKSPRRIKILPIESARDSLKKRKILNLRELSVAFAYSAQQIQPKETLKLSLEWLYS